MTSIKPTVTAEMIERANRARMENLRGKPLADHEYRALRSQVEVDALTAALEAAAPAIAAQALEEAAKDWEGLVQCEIPPVRGSVWLQRRADRIKHDARCPHRKRPSAVGVCCCPAVES